MRSPPLVLVTLGGTAQDQGWVSAARWSPYLLFGLVAGIWVDRFSRKTVLIVADVGRGLLLAVLRLGGVSGWLTVPAVTAIIFGFGLLSLLGDAAYQSFIPQLVPRPLLVRANTRLEQSDTVAQTVGGAVAGGLVALLTAPFALFLDAGSFFLSGATIASLPRRRAPKPEGDRQKLSARIVESLRWIYGHRYLGRWGGAPTSGSSVPPCWAPYCRCSCCTTQDSVQSRWGGYGTLIWPHLGHFSPLDMAPPSTRP